MSHSSTPPPRNLRWLRHRRGRAGALILGLLVLMSVFAEAIAADRPFLVVSNEGVFILPALSRPTKMATAPTHTASPASTQGEFAIWPLARSGPSTVAGQPFAPSTWAHPLGTDAFGRDVLARLVYGTRTAFLLAIAVASVSAVLGCVLGGCAAVYGGVVDSLVQQFVGAVGIFPAVVLVALVRSLERTASIVTLGAVVALVRWAETARLVRALVLSALARDWAQAARAIGASPARIAIVHVGPHVLTPILVSAIFSAGAVVLTETALSFLGLGVPTSVPSWGEMLGEVRWGAGPSVLLPPAFTLTVAACSVYLVAESLSERLTGPLRGIPTAK